MTNKKFKINEAADYLGVSIYTLRRWDDSGRLKSLKINQSNHRYYSQSQLEEFLVDSCGDLAIKWAGKNKGEKPCDLFYCTDSSVFQSRLYKLRNSLSENDKIESLFSLLISIVGEIGDNSFGHNLGNWPDIVGIFFAFNMEKRIIVLADRGQGILKTLKRVRPELKNDTEALKIAFTEIISGRAPESRGNGLKYVKMVVEKNPFSLFFQSGKAELNLRQNDSTLKIKKTKKPIPGCLAIIKF